jgi:hypothetical protein
MAEVVAKFGKLVQPSLVAIYASHHRKDENPVQVGTGFLMDHSSEPVLVTAAHTLWGRTGQEDPGEKAFWLGNSWGYIGDGCGGRSILRFRDIAVLRADELRQRPQIPVTCLEPSPSEILTFGGFLARDFKRRNGVLSPAPLSYTGKRIPDAGGLVGVPYIFSKSYLSSNGQRIRASEPRGLSGGPMVDTAELVNGRVRLTGVFTEQSHGTARGEPAGVIRDMLAEL